MELDSDFCCIMRDWENLVKLVESTIRLENSRAPNKPIFLVGESFGGCLALAVASRNPDIDLILILTNPATSFNKSQLPLQISASFGFALHVGFTYRCYFKHYSDNRGKTSSVTRYDWRSF